MYSLDGKLLLEDNRQLSKRTEYIYAGGRLVAKRVQGLKADGTNNNLPSATTTIHTDFLGSPVAETNASGAVDKVERFTPYGEASDLVLDAGPGFTGHATDVATGLTYMQQRYYDAELGRFLTPDPVGPEEDFINHFNRYNYAQNNPVRYTDPDGRYTLQCLSGVCNEDESDQNFSTNRLHAKSKDENSSKNGGPSTRGRERGGNATQHITGASAFEHYKQGSGAALRMNFSDIDTSNVKPSDFSQLGSLISGNRTGKWNIDAKMAYATKGSDWAILGNITLRLQGGLSLDKHSYIFKGTLKSYDDYYDFNRSTHRSIIGELLTIYGASNSGTPFWIEIRGSKPITQSGERP